MAEAEAATVTDVDTEVASATDVDTGAAAEGGESGDSGNVVLLTGGSGFLAAFLIRALLHNPPPPHGRTGSSAAATAPARLVCLVRAADDAAALERLRSVLQTYELSSDDDAVCTWLKAPGSVLAGDVTRPRLGLSATEHAALVARLRCVVHCAVVVSSALPYEALRLSNVVGTCRAMRLAAAA